MKFGSPSISKSIPAGYVGGRTWYWRRVGLIDLLLGSQVTTMPMNTLGCACLAKEAPSVNSLRLFSKYSRSARRKGDPAMNCASDMIVYRNFIVVV